MWATLSAFFSGFCGADTQQNVPDCLSGDALITVEVYGLPQKD